MADVNPSVAQPGPSCPVTPAVTDETAGRIAALLSLGFVAWFAWQGLGWAVLALAADFLLRAGRPALSPVARAAGFLRRRMGLPGWSINAGPKRFAASVGFLFSLGIGLAFLAGLRPLGLALAVVLGTCAGLEAFFGFCLACRIHPWLPWVWSASAKLLPSGGDGPAA